MSADYQADHPRKANRIWYSLPTIRVVIMLMSCHVEPYNYRLSCRMFRQGSVFCPYKPQPELQDFCVCVLGIPALVASSTLLGEV